MGMIARAPTRRNLIAMAAGIVLAGGSLLAFNFWLNGVVDRQGQEEINTSAERAITLADSRVTQVIHALDRLAAQGVDSCRAGDVETMQKTVFATTPIKEIDVVDAEGHTLCSDLELPLGERKVLSTETLEGTDGYSLDIVRLSDGRRMVRLRRAVGRGSLGIAALVPPILFLPQVSTHGGPFNAYAHIATREGAAIGTIGRHAADAVGRFVAKDGSSRYGFDLEVSTPRAPILAKQAELQRLGLFAASSIVFVMVIFALLLPRRAPGDPIDEMRRALAAGEFVPYYQPIIDIRSGQLCGAEVLVRWRKADGSLVLPGGFIPLAESSGLILDLTRDLMRRVCAEAGPAVGRRPALKISFNVAGKLFGDEAIVSDVRDIFSESPLPLSQIVLELTEREPIESFGDTRQIVAALQELGVRVAIDDVGTGHSGLSYMLKLGVDIIKIDKMFVDAIGTDRKSTTIVETLIDLAHNMRMDVIAEGVETFEQVTHLRELGIRLAQGYVFAPPLPGRSFLQLVEAIDPLPAKAEPKATSGIPIMKKGGLAAAQV
jgi:sensor c-di-GMP phosphodiesterase-like protein